MALIPDPNFDTSQFDLARKRATQTANADKQKNQDALARRFASMGALNSGAAIKQQELSANEADVNKQNALEGIDTQQTAAAQQRQQVLENRQAEQGFASSEAEKARAFQGSEADKGRAFQEKVFNAEQGSRLAQLDLQTKQFNAERGDQAFNRDVAYSQLGGKQKRAVDEAAFARSNGFAYQGSAQQKADIAASKPKYSSSDEAYKKKGVFGI